jgi:hypothetical protein
MAKNPKYKHLYRVIQEFKNEFETELPIKVIRKDIPKHYFGYTTKSKHFFYIYLSNSLNEDVAVYTFLHEATHCLTWNVQIVDHGAKWGLSYSKVYSWYERRHLKD